LLETISTDEENEDGGEWETKKEDPFMKMNTKFKNLLATDKPGLLKMWQGAIEAFHSDNTIR